MADLEKIDLANSIDQDRFGRPSDVAAEQRREAAIGYPQDDRVLIGLEMRRDPSGRWMQHLERNRIHREHVSLPGRTPIAAHLIYRGQILGVQRRTERLARVEHHVGIEFAQNRRYTTQVIGVAVRGNEGRQMVHIVAAKKRQHDAAPCIGLRSARATIHQDPGTSRRMQGNGVALTDVQNVDGKAPTVATVRCRRDSKEEP